MSFYRIRAKKKKHVTIKSNIFPVTPLCLSSDNQSEWNKAVFLKPVLWVKRQVQRHIM